MTLLDRVERPSSDDELGRILSADELGLLLVALPDAYRLIFELASETGGRLSEVLGLAWADVDLDAETVTFTHQLDRQGRRVPLKTRRSRRCLEVTPSLTAKLREHKLASPASGPHDLVFVTRTGRGHTHGSALIAAGFDLEEEALRGSGTQTSVRRSESTSTPTTPRGAARRDATVCEQQTALAVAGEVLHLPANAGTPQ